MVGLIAAFRAVDRKTCTELARSQDPDGFPRPIELVQIVIKYECVDADQVASAIDAKCVVFVGCCHVAPEARSYPSMQSTAWVFPTHAHGCRYRTTAVRADAFFARHPGQDTM